MKRVGNNNKTKKCEKKIFESGSLRTLVKKGSKVKK
jgi:hypothetical protein